MERKRILMVIQRYGKDFVGGSEYECRMLAERLVSEFDIEVLTTCSRYYDPWDNYYSEGVEILDGISVRRFRVEGIADKEAFKNAVKRQQSGDSGANDAYMKGVGPYCPDMIKWLRENGNSYDLVCFFNYFQYHSMAGIREKLPNKMLVPTAHDQPETYYPAYKEVFEGVDAILYNTPEEKAFVEKTFVMKGKPWHMTCAGIDTAEYDRVSPDKALFDGNYIVYIGRLAAGKGILELNAYFREYKRRNPSDLKLLVIGAADNGIRLTMHPDIINLGFVSDKEKINYVRNATALIMPSFFESLSLVILEAMAVGTPILVNGKCAVLKGQCERSGAGFYYMNYFEFEDGLNRLVSDRKLCRELGENGRSFVEENHNWNRVIEGVSGFFQSVIGEE